MLPFALAATLLDSDSIAAPQPDREFRAVWVATVDNIDWPSKKTLTTAQQKNELDTIVATCADLNLNAIIFQIRPSADSLYFSKLEPWSEYLTGKTGKAPKPLYDPLAYLIDKAHARGIEVHAWFNPYRALHAVAKSPASADHITKTHPASAPKYGRYYWMDPSDPIVQKRSEDVMLDVVERYDVDGIHIDDYFYPYPEKGADGKEIPFPDSKNYADYRANGGDMPLKDWRRHHVDEFVEHVYTRTKATKKWVKFGISPFGIYRPGIPAGTTSGIDQFDTLYADVKKWFNEGWCDYMTPQLYWPISQTLQSYPVLLDWWANENTKGRHLWIGNYTGRVLEAWQPKEVLDQIAITRENKASTGNVHFSMKVFLKNGKNLNDKLKEGAYARKALVPASPWLGDATPMAPEVKSVTVSEQQITIEFKSTDKAARFIAVLGEGDRVLHTVRASPTGIFTIRRSNLQESDVLLMRLVCVSRTGVLSSAVKVPNAPK